MPTKVKTLGKWNFKTVYVKWYYTECYLPQCIAMELDIV